MPKSPFICIFVAPPPPVKEAAFTGERVSVDLVRLSLLVSHQCIRILVDCKLNPLSLGSMPFRKSPQFLFHSVDMLSLLNLYILVFFYIFLVIGGFTVKLSRVSNPALW